MRKMRTVLALMLALSLCLTMFPASIFAQADDPITEPVPAVETLVTEPEVEEVDKAPEITTDLAEEDETSQEPEIEVLPEESESEEPAVTKEKQEGELKQDAEIEVAAEETQLDAPAVETKQEESAETEEKSESDTSVAVEMENAETKTADERIVEEEIVSIPMLAIKAFKKVLWSYNLHDLLPAEDGYYVYSCTFYRNYDADDTTQVATAYYYQYPHGSTINPPTISDREGYTFLYWSFERNNGSPIDFNSFVFEAPQYMKAYAIWAKNEDVVTITYDFGEGEVVTKNFVKGADVSFPEAPKRDGFVLDGWHKDGESFDSKTFTESMTLTANWAKAWEVRFVSNDVLVYSCFVKDGDTINGQGGMLNNPGYVFDGWYHLTEDGEKDFQVIWGQTEITEDITFTAVWVKESISTVKYFSDYPDNKPDVSRIKEYKNAGSSISVPDPYKSPINFSKTFGYEFLGWKETHEDPDPNHGTVIGGDEGPIVKKRTEAVQLKSDAKAFDVKDAADEIEGNDDEKLYKIGDEVTLHENVYLTAVWGTCKSVVYRTGYYDGFTFNGKALVNDEQWVTYSADETEFKVSDYDAEPLKFAKPDGYVFAGWEEIVIDTEDLYNKYFPEKLIEEEANQGGNEDWGTIVVKKVRSAIRSEASIEAKSDEIIEEATLKVIVQPYSETSKPEKLHTVVLLVALWEEIPSYHVLYDTNYPTAANMKEDAKWVDRIEITDPSRAYEYEIKGFETVSEAYKKIYGEDRFIEPAGWTFIGWSEKPGEQPVIDYKFTDLGPKENNDAVTVDPATYIPTQEQNNAGNETATGGQSGMVAKESKYDKVFYAQWKQSAVVYYHTNYPGSTGLQNDHFEVFENHEFAENTFTVKTFTDAFKGTSYEEPLGYKFVCWEMEVIDPKEAGDITQEENSEQNKDVEEEAQASAEVLQEAKKEVKAEKKEAIPAEKKDSVVTTEKEQSDSTEQEARPGTRPDFDAETATKLPQVQAGSKQDIHLEVHLFAIWEPCFKVIYHRVDPKSDFALDNKIEDQTYRVDYSVAQYKDGEGLFEVLSYPDTKLDGIPGYEFDYWTMTISDPRNPKDPNPANPFNPGEQRPMEPERLEEAQAEKEYLKEESKAQDVRMIFNAAKGTVPAEAEQANKAESVEFLGKIEAEKIKDEVGESTTPNDSAEEKTDDPAGDAVDKIYPKDKEELHAEVHLYAWWKAKPYTVIWVDEDGKTPFGDSYPEDNNDKNDKGYPADSYMAGETQPAGDQYGDGPDKDGKVFDHWEKTGGEDGVGDIVYTAVYRDVQQNNPPVDETERPNTRPSTNRPSANETPITPEDPVTEEPTEIDDGDTPLAPGTVEEEDTNIDDGDVPLAGAEEEEAIAEEATPLTPFTGDERNTAVWSIVSILSLLGIALLTFKRRREE